MTTASSPTSTTEDLKAVLKKLHLPQLRELMGFVGQSRYGNKPELVEKCKYFLNTGKPGFAEKMMDLARNEMDRKTIIQRPRPFRGFPHSRNSQCPSASHPIVPTQKNCMDVNASLASIPSLSNSLPKFPSLRMWPLPFHDVLTVLLPPTELRGSENEECSNNKFEFVVFEPVVFSDGVNLSSKTEVLMRFFAHEGDLDPSEAEHEYLDLFPPNLSVMVNEKPIEFNEIRMTHDRKKYSHPVCLNNSGKKKLIVKVEWQQDQEQPPPNANSFKQPKYFVSVYQCRPLTLKEVFSRIAAQSRIPSTCALSKIQRVLGGYENEIESVRNALPVSLTCPFTMRRIVFPCIGTQCTHVPCFDLYNFLQINHSAKRLQLRCPLCKIPLKIEEIRIDQFYMNLLKNVPGEVKEIELDHNGNWMVEGVLSKNDLRGKGHPANAKRNSENHSDSEIMLD